MWPAIRAPRRCRLALLLLPAALACGDRGVVPVDPPPRPGAASPPAQAAPASELLIDRGRESGLDFVHFNGMTGKRYMAEVMGSGLALLDMDNDGDLDLYLVQGGPLAPGETVADALVPPQPPGMPSDRLYRNDLAVGPDGARELRWTDVTDPSGVGAVAKGYGMGAAAGDYDNDGLTDLYITRLGPNQLLRNQGDGTFRDVTGEAGVAEGRWSVPALFFDFDRDGFLDLFVGNYVDFPFEERPDCRDSAGRPDYCGPDQFAPLSDRYFRNRGDGTFEDATERVGLDGARGRALGALAADFDGNGLGDLYVANDGMANQLWLQHPDGRFTDAALEAGAAVNGEGRAEGSMGVDAADLDGDGDLDLFMTHLITETNTLYLNEGGGLFRDGTDLAGLGAPSRLHTAFGTGFFDLDNDGLLDLLVVNGAVQNLEALVNAGDPFPLHEADQLFRHLPPRAGEPPRFEEITGQAGPAFAFSEVSRGAAFGDLDNDGDTDVVVSHNNGPARQLTNRAADGSRWLGLRLVAGSPPRDLPGARAALLSGGRPWAWRWVRVAGSYASSSDPRLLFGLAPPGGEPPRVEGVRVVWPDGTVEDFAVPALERYTTLRRGGGRPPGEGGR